MPTTRALSLATVIGSDGALNLADVAGLATVAGTGSYTDLTNKPTIPSSALTFTGDVTGTGTTGTSTALTLANSGVSAGSYGTASAIPAITVDAKGRITSISTNAVSIPSGSISVTGGDITMSGNTGSDITNATLANSGATAGTYGSNSAVPQITVDAKGRITNVSSVNISSLGDTVIESSGTSAALRITQTGSGNALLVEDNTNPDSTPFVIDATGTVTVGKSTPESNFGLLQVHGIGSFIFGTASYQSNSNATVYNIAKSRGATAGDFTIVQSGDDLGSIRFSGADGTNFVRAAQISVAVDGTPGTNDMPGRLVFSTTADGATIPTERMRIDSAGQVTIGGTPVAGRTLRVVKTLTGATAVQGIQSGGTVQSDVTSNASFFNSFPSTAAASFTLTSLIHYESGQGTFGAGSTVTNQYGFSVGSTLTGATNNYGFYSNIASGTGRWNFYAVGTAQNYFAGTTLIGTTTNTNSSTLVVNGTASVTVGGTQYLVVDQSDIGTAPNEIPLNQYLGNLAYQDASSIAGDAVINSVTVGRGGGGVSSNTATGYQALYANTTGYQNTAVGYQAMSANTTGYRNTGVGYQAMSGISGGGGFLNTAVGEAALARLTTGYTNTAIGFNALANETTGTENTAVGSSALNAANGATRNTAVGVGAAGAITTATNNVAIGAYNTASGDTGTLRTNTTGSYNIAIGNGALRGNTTASYNVAIGDAAMYANTTASNDVAIGYQAIYSANPGVSGYSGNNVAIGYRALYSAGSVAGNGTSGVVAIGYNAGYAMSQAGNGAYNTYVGTSAGRDNVSGYANTFIGANAGYAMTSGTGLVVIGYGAGRQSAGSGGGNSVYIGNGAGNTGANDNCVVGAGAGGVAGGECVYIGTYAANSATGGNNVAIGKSSMYNPTSNTGSNNTALGHNSLYSLTSGSDNVAVGYGAGAGVTTGYQNIFIGRAGYQSTITGDKNIIIGVEYGAPSLTSGRKNVGIGHKVFGSLSSGGSNLAIGPSEGGIDLGNLQSVTTGGSNVAIGSGNLGRVTTGSANVAIGGNNAGTQITTGNFNVLISSGQAGQALTTAYSNVFIGTYPGGGGAGFDPGYYMTGNQNTILAAWNGNQDSLDLRTSNAQVVIGAQNGNWGARLDATSTANSWYQRSNSSTWATTSDRRIKTNFQPVTNGLEIINALKPTEFDYILTGQHDVSFIAQEYEEVLPDQVVEDASNKSEQIMALTNGEPIKILKKNLDPYLVSAIQALTEQVNQLKAEIANLKGA